MFFGIFAPDGRRSSAIQFRLCRTGRSDSDDNLTMASLRALTPGRELLDSRILEWRRAAEVSEREFRLERYRSIPNGPRLKPSPYSVLNPAA